MSRSHDRGLTAPQSPSPSAPSVGWTGPFHLEAGGDTLCLLIHGFTATPQEMLFLGESLHAAGHTVYGARVAGHGTSVEDFERASWRDWLASLHEQLIEVRGDCKHVVVVGQSMGALLALSLAAEYPADISAVAVLAPALVLQRRWLERMRPFLPLMANLPGQRWRYLPTGRSDIADPTAHVERERYDRVPLRAVHQLLSLQRHTRRQLRRIQQPVLVIHSHQDHTCSPDAVRLLERRLLKKPEIVMLDDSYHVVSVDFDRERVAAAVDAFATRTHPI